MTLEFVEKDPSKKRYSFFKCHCGKVKSYFTPNVERGLSKSCGCANPPREMIGKRFGLLTVLEKGKSERRGNQRRYWWLCECDCGRQKEIQDSALRDVGGTKSCGCAQYKSGEDHHLYKHGMAGSKWHVEWKSIKYRCATPGYKDYHDKGIRVDSAWVNDFETFYKDMKEIMLKQGLTEEYIEGYQVDRIDGDKDYCRGNIKFSTPPENCRHRSVTKYVEVFGQRLCFGEAIEKYSKLSYDTVFDRIEYKEWDVERALITPTLPNLRKPSNYNVPLTEQEREEWLEHIAQWKEVEVVDHLLENDIRDHLIPLVTFKYSPCDVYKELGGQDHIADLAVLTDEKFIGFEIKSDGDKLGRFKTSQKIMYPYFYDECWLVVTEKHIEKAKSAIGDNWGLMDNLGNIIVPAPNIDDKDRLYYQLDKVWNGDLKAECKSLGASSPFTMEKHELIKFLLSRLTPTQIRKFVRKFIKEHSSPS